MPIESLIDQGAPPIVAILRGVTPDAAVAVGSALVEAGILLIEVPLNSPQPLESIARLRQAVSSRCLIGAGTVLSPEQVDGVADVGGQFIVSPDTSAAVIVRSLQLGLDSLPGFFTATEAFAAVAAGARNLKLFPAQSAGAKHFAAIREVLPRDVKIWAVGGIEAGNLAEWLGRGAAGVGIGGSIFKPEMPLNTVRQRAEAVIRAWQAAAPSGS